MEWNDCSLLQQHHIAPGFCWSTPSYSLLSQDGLRACDHLFANLHDTPDVLMNIRLHSTIRGCRRSSGFRLAFRDYRVSRVPKLYKLRHKHQAKILFREFETARIVLETIGSEPDNSSSLRNCLRLLLVGCLRATSLETVSSSHAALLPRQLELDLILDDESARFCPMPSLTWSKRLYSLIAQQARYSFTGTYIAVLGGAYSALGKYKVKYAKKAGELALKQIRLAQLMHDPIQESKCWLYYAEGCVGIGMLRAAARIIRRQHAFAHRIHDETLVKMCESTRAKLAAARDNLSKKKV